MENHSRKSIHALVGHRKYTPSKTRKIKHYGAKGGENALETQSEGYYL
jgi:hypothetical protein